MKRIKAALLVLGCLAAQSPVPASGADEPLVIAGKEAVKLIAASRHDRLIRLLPKLETLEMRINSADLLESAAHPQGVAALREDGWCDMKQFGLCWGLNWRFTPVVAFKKDELVKYHRQAADSLRKSNDAALDLARLLAREKADPAYEPQERAVLAELSASVEKLLDLTRARAPWLVAAHEAYLAACAGRNPESGLLDLKDDPRYLPLLNETSAFLRTSSRVAACALEKISAHKEPRAAVIGSDRSALDAALADPRDTLLLFFGKPGTPAAAACEEALKVAEDWNKVFLITDASVLSAEEKESWRPRDGTYVALARTRVPLAGGPAHDLYESDGVTTAPSTRRLVGVLARADCGEPCGNKNK